MKRLWFLILIPVCIYAASCGNSRPRECALAENDSILVARVLALYDDHVMRVVGQDLPVDVAYGKFMEMVRVEWEKSPSLALLNPEIEELLDFLYDMITGYLSSDIATAFYGGYPLRGWSIGPGPGIFKLLERAGKRNGFWLDFIDPVKAVGDFSPTLFSSLLHFSGQIDYGYDIERFLVAFMLMPTHVDIENFVLQMDVDENRIMLEEYSKRNDYKAPYYNYDYKRTD